MSTAESNADIQILYVEDDPASGRLVQSIAETAGYEVDVVTTGSEFIVSDNEQTRSAVSRPAPP